MIASLNPFATFQQFLINANINNFNREIEAETKLIQTQKRLETNSENIDFKPF